MDRTENTGFRARGFSRGRALPTVMWGLALALSLRPAAASSDYDQCKVKTWSVKISGQGGCGNNLPFLSPSNDRLVNLQLLLRDAAPDANLIAPTTGPKDGLVVPASVATFTKLLSPEPVVPHSEDASGAVYASGEGSRCRSNQGGIDAFLTEVNTETAIAVAERAELSRLRQALVVDCVSAPTAADDPIINVPSSVIRSERAQEFANYMSAAAAFYQGEFDDALTRFGALQRSSQPWVRETASYMLGRAQLNRAQKASLDEWGYTDPAKIDLLAADAARQALLDYLERYPDGRYAASARGLLRRADWFRKAWQPLAAEYERLLTASDSLQGKVSRRALLIETGRFFNVADTEAQNAPLILATQDLRAIANGTIALDRLQAQKTEFSRYPALFDYLLAAHALYLQHKPEVALAVLPDTRFDRPLNYLAFSQQTLRALALEETGAWQAARVLWQRLLPLARQPLQRQQLELALAINLERHHDLPLVFAPDSLVRDAGIRDLLLSDSAGPDLLRQLARAPQTSAHERRQALFTLLYKDLLYGQYADFLANFALLPTDARSDVVLTESPIQFPSNDYEGRDNGQTLGLFYWQGSAASPRGFSCPSLRAVARALSENPGDPAGRLCLGDFIRANQLDDFTLSGESASDRPVLGAAPTGFPGKLFLRLDEYQQIIADPAATADDKAYALYRAIQCHASSGANHCGGANVERSVRKEWFNTLKRSYGGTVWARSLRYYW